MLHPYVGIIGPPISGCKPVNYRFAPQVSSHATPTERMATIQLLAQSTSSLVIGFHLDDWMQLYYPREVNNMGQLSALRNAGVCGTGSGLIPQSSLVRFSPHPLVRWPGQPSLLIFMREHLKKQLALVFTVLASGTLLSGCGSSRLASIVDLSPGLAQKTITLAPPTPFSVVQQPALQTSVTAELGDTLIVRSYVKVTEALRLDQGINHDTTNYGSSIRIEIDPGTLKPAGKDSAGTFFVSDSLHKTLPAHNLREKTRGGIYIPFDATHPKLLYWVPGSTDQVIVDKPVQPVEVTPLPNQIEASPDNRKKELIYTGVSKNVISILYREYQDDLVRPAYTQELKYDLSEGKIIGFKGARFELEGATNIGIKYKVLRHLD